MECVYLYLRTCLSSSDDLQPRSTLCTSTRAQLLSCISRQALAHGILQARTSWPPLPLQTSPGIRLSVAVLHWPAGSAPLQSAWHTGKFPCILTHFTLLLIIMRTLEAGSNIILILMRHAARGLLCLSKMMPPRCRLLWAQQPGSQPLQVLQPWSFCAPPHIPAAVRCWDAPDNRDASMLPLPAARCMWLALSPPLFSSRN